jgi:aspartate kinase
VFSWILTHIYWKCIRQNTALRKTNHVNSVFGYPEIAKSSYKTLYSYILFCSNSIQIIIMPTFTKTLVMKFGGAAVADIDAFAKTATLIQARRQGYDAVIVVVSAMRGTTDQLIALAHSVNQQPPQREYDMLITVGERISCSLLAMALHAQGCESYSYTGSQAGIITCERHTDASILDVRPHRLQPALERGAIAVVAGFQGVSQGGAITTLGRGGSDTTAVALGVAFRSTHVEFYKDVPGIYNEDPKRIAHAQHLPFLSYDSALSIAARTGPVLHPRCLKLAQRNGIPLHVRSFVGWNHPEAPLSIIGHFPNGEETCQRSDRTLYEELCAV